MELKESKVEMGDDSFKKEIGDLPKDLKEKSMQCSVNLEDHSFYTEEDNSGGVGGGSKRIEVEEEEVDVLESTASHVNKETEAVSECNDGTDVYSSSFSGTVSGNENETASNENDQEADSSMVVAADTSLPLWVRKKKLTDHWRKFIQPIMWRCKWVELKVKQLQNQARMYDKELEDSRQAKQTELENLKSNELGVKAAAPSSLPCYSQRNQVKKRKKRERVEETSDVAAYTSNHNLFSYDEYRKSFADVALNDNSVLKKNKNGKEETVFCEETPLLEFREGDACLEQILLKIEAAKLEVRNLKNRVDKVVNENPTRFSSANNTLNVVGSADIPEQQKPLVTIKNEEDEKPVVSEEKSVKSASVSSHHDTQPEDDEDDTTDVLLSEMLASKRREGKATVLDKKTEQKPVEEGPSRPARKRKPRNLDMVVKEESKPKRQRVSKEKPKSNAATMASRFKKRKRGKRRSGSTGLRRRS